MNDVDDAQSVSQSGAQAGQTQSGDQTGTGGDTQTGENQGGDQSATQDGSADVQVSAAQSRPVDNAADHERTSKFRLMAEHAVAALKSLEEAAVHALTDFDRIVIADAKAIIGKLKALRDHAPEHYTG